MYEGCAAGHASDGSGGFSFFSGTLTPKTRFALPFLCSGASADGLADALVVRWAAPATVLKTPISLTRLCPAAEQPCIWTRRSDATFAAAFASGSGTVLPFAFTIKTTAGPMKSTRQSEEMNVQRTSSRRVYSFTRPRRR